MKIDGSGKADIVKKEEKDGIMTFVYVPVSAGEYNINIRFKNKHIHGSPFSAKISGFPYLCILYSLVKIDP